jgi:diaminohydroxyphosphoribosylaminopyrimidine deaminase/5-amino-6-(5-phosphoribosylamino)uracil reductase
LVEAGVARVVAAMRDPNPLVAGRGLALLEEAGVATDCGLLEDEALALNPGFAKRMSQGLPYVRCKLAMSLDGRTAMASGESKWITSEAARRDVQRLRARSEAIVTGIGTVLADDPSLNVRLADGELPGVQGEDELIQPVRVVLDSRLRMPPGARMLSLAGQTLVMCVDQDPTHAARLEAAGAHIYRAPESHGRVDLQAALSYLAGQDINEVLLEAGPTLAGQALQAGVVDELVIYMAPHLMGDMARGLFSLPALRHMHQRIELGISDVRAVGRDWRITARPAPRESGRVSS